MEYEKVNQWEQAVDAAEANPLTANLPGEAPPGMEWSELSQDGLTRQWVRVTVVTGRAGGRWAYWAKKEDFTVVVDTLFNGDAHHFVGMLAIPFTPFSTHHWVLVSPKVVPPPTPRPELDKPTTRYERSKEVYNVDTGETTFL